MRFLAQPESDLRAAEFLRSRFVRLSDAALVALAPAFVARAAREPGVRRTPGVGRSTPGCWPGARAVGRPRGWRLADRVPPSELARRRAARLRLRLRDCAGGVWTRRARTSRRCAPLVRRVENRGYATLGRLARYFDTLRAGDDSNAIVEAADAVNLMTIHAAKGLEFPIVFVVNLHAPGRGRGAGFSVIERGPSGEPEVTFGIHAGHGPRGPPRDWRNSVGCCTWRSTRARDRLYLAAEVDRQGRRRTRRAQSGVAAAAHRWRRCSPPRRRTGRASSGMTGPARSAFRVCRPGGRAERRHARRRRDPADASRRDAGSPHRQRHGRIGVGARAGGDGAAAGARRGPAWRRSPRRHPGRTGCSSAGSIQHPGRRRSQRLMASCRARAYRRAAPTWSTGRRPCGPRWSCIGPRGPRRDVRGAAGVGRCLLRSAGLLPDPGAGRKLSSAAPSTAWLPPPDGALTVVEFKTGGPRPEHEQQAALYARAVQAAFRRPACGSVVCYP